MLKKVLIVEDNKEQAEATQRLILSKLESLGSTAFCAFSLAEARERIARNNISLILLDVSLEDSRDPFETLKVIRETHIPVIVTTGTMDSEVVARAFEYGARDFYIKSKKPEELVEKIGYVLQKVYPESRAARIAVEAHQEARAKAPSRIGSFFEVWGTRATFAFTIVTLGAMAWRGITSGHDYVEQQAQEKVIAKTAKEAAAVTQATVVRHDKDLRAIQETQINTNSAIEHLAQSVDKLTASVGTLHDSTIKGEQDRLDMKEQLNRVEGRLNGEHP